MSKEVFKYPGENLSDMLGGQLNEIIWAGDLEAALGLELDLPPIYLATLPGEDEDSLAGPLLGTRNDLRARDIFAFMSDYEEWNVCSRDNGFDVFAITEGASELLLTLRPLNDVKERFSKTPATNTHVALTFEQFRSADSDESIVTIAVEALKGSGFEGMAGRVEAEFKAVAGFSETLLFLSQYVKLTIPLQKYAGWPN